MKSGTGQNSSLVEVLRAMSLNELEAQLHEVTEKQALLHTERTLLELAIELKRAQAGTEGSAADRVVGQKPSLRVALTHVMDDGNVWSPSNLRQELQARGWLPQSKNPSTQITNRLSEMVKRGEVVQLGRGKYQLALHSA